MASLPSRDDRAAASASPSLIGLFLKTVERHRKPAQFMRRSGSGWESIPAERSLADVESLALGLAALGIARGQAVAILSENRYEWPVSDLAILGLGAVTVPIYATLTSEQVRFILDNCTARAVVVSNAAQLDKIRAMRGALPELGTVIVMDGAGALRDGERSFADVQRAGAAARDADPLAFRRSAESVDPESVATIIYTSGTTGEPKGAMLSHRNIASNVDACLERVDLRVDDTCLSFLPLCHIFERMAGLYAMLRVGATIAYAESLDTVAANAVEVQPTILNGVPRFYEKAHARILDSAASMPPLRRRLFHWGLAKGRERARARFQGRVVDSLLHRLADRLVGSKIRARLGGRLRYCISGGAPLAPDVMEFFFAIGVTVIEGYGLTETSPVICLNPPGREKPGSVGPPVAGVEVRIGDEGEIQTRGPHVMLGYFRNEEATRLALRDGWFHTGDVGRFDDQGYLTITDRLKDLLVTAGGKKVAPQPMEQRLKTSRWVTEAVLVGDRRPYITALIVPNFANLEAEARARAWPGDSRHELTHSPGARALYQQLLDELNATLAPFETIKRFELLDRELSQDAGELTPTLKVKRRVIQERFAAQIEALYAAGGHAPVA